MNKPLVPPSSASSSASYNATSKPLLTALIADDDKELRELMAETLQELGYFSIAVADGKACIEKLKGEEPVDVVFLDLKMAPQDGLSTLKIMHTFTNPVRHLPTFMLTGFVDERLVAAAKALGAADYLVKPLDPSKLRERLFTKVLTPIQFDDQKEILSSIYFEDKNILPSLKDPHILQGFKAYPLTQGEDKWVYIVKQEISPRSIISMPPEQQVSTLAIYKKEGKEWRCVWPTWRQYLAAKAQGKKSGSGILGELGIA